MDDNKKALFLYTTSVVTFVIAAIFQYVIGHELIGWGVNVAVTLCALLNLYCLTAPQSLGRRLPIGFRTFLFLIAFVLGGIFGLLFMSWLVLAIYLVAILAGTMFFAAISN